MKIAVCFFGQLRTGIETAPSMLRYLGPLYSSCDFFVHTWKNQTSWRNGIEGQVPHSEILEIDADRLAGFYKIYKPTTMTVDDHQLWKKNRSFRYEDPRLYTIRQVNELKKLWEKQHNFTYDYVVMTRPDFIFHKEKTLLRDLEQVIDPRVFTFSAVLADTNMCDPLHIHSEHWVASSYVIDRAVDFDHVIGNRHPTHSVDGLIHLGQYLKYGLGFCVELHKDSRIKYYRPEHVASGMLADDYDNINPYPFDLKEPYQ